MNPYIVILTHRILVSVFLLHYVWKGYLLLADKKDTLAAYTAKTRIAEMVVALAFMVTGFYLAYTGPGMSVLLWIKIAMVFASIPIAIIGFKQSNKAFAVLAIILLVGAYGLAEMNKAINKKAKMDTSNMSGDVAIGKAVFTAQCATCHGPNGDANVYGAKNLKITKLSDDQMKEVIRKGVPNTQMHGFEGLTDEQVNGLVSYIRTLGTKDAL